jgi:hypothetical protein
MNQSELFQEIVQKAFDTHKTKIGTNWSWDWGISEYNVDDFAQEIKEKFQKILQEKLEKKLQELENRKTYTDWEEANRIGAISVVEDFIEDLKEPS